MKGYNGEVSFSNWRLEIGSGLGVVGYEKKYCLVV